MKHGMYAIYDSASLAWLPPFVSFNDNTAKRAFSEVANDPQHQIGKHAVDFSLHKIAEFDDQQGTVVPVDLPTNLGLATAYKGQT